MQVLTFYSGLFGTAVQTAVKCSTEGCCVGGQQDVGVSIFNPKYRLIGDVMSIPAMVEVQMKPDLADCNMCTPLGLKDTISNTDHRLALPDVYPLMVGRESVSPLQLAQTTRTLQRFHFSRSCSEMPCWQRLSSSAMSESTMCQYFTCFKLNALPAAWNPAGRAVFAVP